MDPEVSFGAWVALQRKALDLTRELVAQCAGCSVSALRKIEADERRPSRQLAELLAQCLQVPAHKHTTFVQAGRGLERVQSLGAPRPVPAGRPSGPLPERPVSRLPIPTTALVGREPEHATLARLLRDPQCRLLTLVGPSGIGKTRLALAVASSQRELFVDGVCFVPLVSLSSPQFVVPAIADALGFTFAGRAEPYAQLLNHLEDKSLLLVLDNLEHLLEAAALLAELLQKAPGLKLLVTSHERLNLHGEWLFEIEGLPVPPLDQAGRAEEYSAVELFVQAAQRVKAGFVLGAEERLAASRICHLVEGMPLAIELAAAWISVLTCQEIAQEIERNLDFLSSEARDVPERHRSLRATFDHSWGLLSAHERSVLCQLSVFQGGFERAAAEQITGATLTSLSALASKSLLHRTKSGRYDLHEIVRQYALSYLSKDAQHEAAARDRHSEFYLSLMRDREVALKRASQREAIRELTDEIDNVRAAWPWAVKGRKFALLEATLRCFGLLFDMRGWLREGIEQLELLVQTVSPDSDDGTQCRLLGQALAQQGLLFFRQGYHEQAQSRFEESLAILRPMGDPALLLDPLIFDGIVMFLCGEVDQAQALIAEGLACARDAGDSWFMALALFNQGYVASLLGRYDEAYQQMSASLALWRALGDLRLTALGLNFLSPSCIKLGKHDEARAFLYESLALCTQVGDRWGMGTAYRHLGLLALAQHNVPRAQVFLNRSLELFNELGARWDIVSSLVYLGEATALAEDLSEARQIFLKTLPSAMEIRAVPLVLDAVVGLAAVHASMGEPERALDLAMCALYHAAATQAARDRAQDLIARLEEQLTSQQLAAAQARTQARSFNMVVTELCRESDLGGTIP